jgi:chromosome segregation ATPase
MILSAPLVMIGMTSATRTQDAAPAPKPPLTATDRQRAEVQTLTQSLQELNQRMGILTNELKHFKTDLAEVTTLWRVMLLEQRQALVDQQLAEVQRQVWDLEGQETAIRARLQNLDKEYIATGSAFVSQEQARRQIRQQLERELQHIATRRPPLLAREQDLRDRLNELRSKLEEIKRELEAIERKRAVEKEERQ